MLKLVRRARGRLLSNNLLSEGANVFSVALAVFIVLLVAGAQVLNWRWALTVPLAAAAIGIYRALRNRPSLYATAQLIDSRMKLADTLSTAFFFGGVEEQGRYPAQKLQWEQAERVSRTVDVSKAVPYRLPRSAYLLGALFLVASSLFALRYAVNRRLDLKAPLARLLQLNLPGLRTEEAKLRRPDPPTPEQKPDEDSQQSAGDRSANRDAQAQKATSPSVSAADAQRKSQGRRTSQGDSQEQNRQANAESVNGEQQGSQGRQNASGSSGREDGNTESAQNQSGQQTGSSGNSSLMDKVKDAVQSLLSRMNPNSGRQGGQQQAQQTARNQQQQGAGNRGQARQQAAQSGRQGGNQDSGQESGQQGEADRMAQGLQEAAGSRGAGNSERQEGKQPGSGIGSEDGDKAVKEAQQIQAMGKISEILGRRSANLSGEATVEVRSSGQRLSTPYAQIGSKHSEAGAEIGRDEVPVALEAYVERYFQNVRKQRK